jgi:hypothetical protein
VLSAVVLLEVLRGREVGKETGHGVSGVESAARGETAVLGIAKKVPGGPAGAGCAAALLAYIAVMFVLG